MRGRRLAHPLRRGRDHRRHPRQLRPLLHRHLQRGRTHRVERQLHGSQDDQSAEGRVSSLPRCRRRLWPFREVERARQKLGLHFIRGRRSHASAGFPAGYRRRTPRWLCCGPGRGGARSNLISPPFRSLRASARGLSSSPFPLFSYAQGCARASAGRERRRRTTSRAAL